MIRTHVIRTVVIGAVGTAVLAGTGAGALAMSSGPTTPGSGSSASSGSSAHTGATARTHAKRALWREAARRAAEGDVVVKGKDGAFTTVEFARGTATVSSSSLAVATTDGHTVTFTLNAATKYHVRADKKTTKGSASSVHDGDTVVVIGKAPLGTTPTTATQVLDFGAAT